MAKATTYSCQIVSQPARKAIGIEVSRTARPEFGTDEDRPAPHPVDPYAGGDGEQDERQELEDAEQAELEGAHLEGQHGDERDRKLGDLVAELADRLRRPQLHEVAVAPERSPRRGGGGCLGGDRIARGGVSSDIYALLPAAQSGT